MHELGILYHVVEQVTRIAAQNRLSRVDTLVLQVGELSGVIPRYLEACYPAAVDGTLLEDTKLKIETLAANGRCRACGNVFGITEHGKYCPQCGGGEYEVLGGREFFIKEIVAC